MMCGDGLASHFGGTVICHVFHSKNWLSSEHMGHLGSTYNFTLACLREVSW